MAGLLDYGDPLIDFGTGLLGMSGATRLPTGMGQALAAGMQNMDAGQARRLQLQMELQKGKLMDAQIGNYNSEVATREAALRKQLEGAAALNRILGGGQPSYAPGQLGSGSFGVTPSAAPYGGGAASGGGLANATPEQIAALEAQYGYKLGDLYKLAKEGLERKPGTFYRNVTTGQDEYTPDVKTGLNYSGGAVTPIPGFANTTAQFTLAQKLPEAFASAAGRVNLRKNADGTESPVPELTENPGLQGLVSQFLGGAQPLPTTQAPAAPARLDRATPAGNVVAPVQQKAADAESIRMIQSELANEKDPVQRQALTRELQRLTASQSQPGFPTPTLARPTGYGMTTEQQAAAEAAKARAVEQARQDVQPTASRLESISSLNNLSQIINQAIAHPGRETATGASSLFHPANYIPGTDATNFKSVLDQIKGSTFLQAFNTLKGGGQITEVEGKKATDAIARLSTAQSDEEFKKSLQELQQVVQNGLIRAKSNLGKATGDSGSFPGDNTNLNKSSLVPELPKTAAKGARARDTETGKTFVFDGLAWKEAK